MRQAQDNETTTTSSNHLGRRLNEMAHQQQEDAATNNNSSNITRIYLLGERNTGTKFMEQLLGRNFPSLKGYNGFSQDIPVVGYKHMVSFESIIVLACFWVVFSKESYFLRLDS